MTDDFVGPEGWEPPTDEEVAQQNEKRLLKLERDREERDRKTAEADVAKQAAADEASRASLEQHKEIFSAHIDAVHADNQAAREALQALQDGKPLQDGELPEPTLPEALPSLNLNI